MSIEILEKKQRPAQVMLIEDNHGDVLLTRRAFQESKIANELSVATSGEEAIAMLRKESPYAQQETPDLILLDLNLPQMNGQEVLKKIKEDPTLKHIPVIILSSSRADQDVVKSYALHAGGYVIKPVSLEKFNEVVQKLETFWFTLVVMPDAQDVKKAS